MKKILKGVLTTFLGILALCVLGVLALVVTWLVRREDPTSFLPDRYVAYVQVPSLRAIYDQWLTLEAADVVLARPELAPYHGVLTDARGLALTRAPVLRTLLDVRADVMLLPEGKIVAVLDIGWRGILTPLARFVGPLLRIKGFSFLNDAGLPMYRYTAGATTIHAALANNVVLLSIDADTVKEALARRASHTGLAARASRELLDRIRLRSSTAVRVLVDTQGMSTDLLGATPFGAKVLDAVEIPGQTMLDVQLSNTRLQLGAALPVSVSLPELSKVLAGAPAPIGILRYVPSSAQLLTISNIAPLADLYRLAAAFQGKDVQDIFARADSGARTVLGAGIDELLFSWVGAEVGAFMQPGSAEAVFFAKITDAQACTRAIARLTTSAVAGRDSSLVLDGIRIDRLSLPWYMGLILDALGVNVPEPYFLVRDNYIFVSLDAQNLAAVVRAADTGDNLAQTSLYARLAERIPADSSFFAWYDMSRSEPFFIRGSGLLADILRLYTNGVVAIRATPAEVRLSLAASRAATGGAKLLPGFPLAPSGVVSGDVLAFRFTDSSSLTLAWIRDRSVLVLADAGGTELAEAKLEPDSVLVPERGRSRHFCRPLGRISRRNDLAFWRPAPSSCPVPPRNRNREPHAARDDRREARALLEDRIRARARGTRRLPKRLLSAVGGAALCAARFRGGQDRVLSEELRCLGAPERSQGRGGARMAGTGSRNIVLRAADRRVGTIVRRHVSHPGRFAARVGPVRQTHSAVSPHAARRLLRNPRYDERRGSSRAGHPGAGRRHPAGGPGRSRSPAGGHPRPGREGRPHSHCGPGRGRP